MHRKKIHWVFLLVFPISLQAQIGCESDLQEPIIAGPDSLHTDGDQSFRSLEINPTDPNIVYIGTEGNGFFKSIDGGQNWTWHREGFKVNYDAYAEHWDIAVHPSNSQILYTAMTDSPGPIQGNYPSAMAGIYISEDGGQTWAQRNCGLPNSKGNAIWVDPLNPSSLLCTIQGGTPSFTNPPQNFYEGGIYKSIDGGLNWTTTNFPSNFNNQSLYRLLQKGDTLITCGLGETDPESQGFLFSTDRGQNWQGVTANNQAGEHVFYYSIGPNANMVYFNRMDQHDIRVLDITNNTLTSTDFGNGNYLGIVKVHPDDQNTVFFATGGGSQLYKTINGLGDGNIFDNAQYTHIQDFDKFVESIEFAPSDHSIVYLATRGYRIYKSTDGGNNFSFLINLRNIINTASIREDELKETEIKLIPNPINQNFSIIEIQGLKSEESLIEIFDQKGTLLVHQSLSSDNNTINLQENDLNPGIYFVNITNINGRIIKKLIIK